MNVACGGLGYADGVVMAQSFNVFFTLYFFIVMQLMFEYGYMCKSLRLAVAILDLN